MSNKEAATKEKELGNAAYKKKDFPTAITHYTKVRKREGTGKCCL
jgi:stress-induced-phosphoprotein 1